MHHLGTSRQRVTLMQFLRHEQSGATAIEYALIAPVFVLLMGAIAEYGMYTFHSIAAESLLQQAARTASMGKTADSTGPCSTTATRVDYIKCYLEQKSIGMLNANSLTVISRTIASGGTDTVPDPDICLKNPIQVGGTCPPGTPWQDVNKNGVYDSGSALDASGMGGSEETVEIRMYYAWRTIMPLMDKFLGCQGDGLVGCQPGVSLISSATVVKNEPFADDGLPSGSSSGSSSSSSTSSSTGGEPPGDQGPPGGGIEDPFPCEVDCGFHP